MLTDRFDAHLQMIYLIVLFLARSAWSRAYHPIEIGDLSKAESLYYLIDKCALKTTEAEKLYDLVGGRMVDLKYVANQYLNGNSIEGRHFILHGSAFDHCFNKKYCCLLLLQLLNAKF